MSRLVKVDANTKWLLEQIGNTKGGENYRAPYDEECINPSRLVITALFNLVSGHWVVARPSLKGYRRKDTNILRRTPLDSLNQNYIHIVPNYVGDLAKSIGTLKSAIEAGDKDTSLKILNSIHKEIYESVTETPPEVLKLTETMPDFSKLFVVRKCKEGNKKYRTYINPNIPEKDVEELANFIDYDDGKPLIER
jgi:hypothetical protein